MIHSLDQYCSIIKNALVSTIGKHNIKTVDIGGTSTTTEFMKKVIEEIDIHTPEIGIVKYIKKNTGLD